MGFAMLSPGETAYYPNVMNKSDRTMTVLDRKVVIWPKSHRIYVRYLLDGLMEHFVEDCHKNVENEYDNIIVVFGREGSGKSTYAIQLAMALDPNFDLETDYIYTYEEMVQAITDPDKSDIGRVFLLDETSSIMNNRDAMTTSSKNMVELLEMMRSRGWTLIMCIPSPDRLDKYLRDFRIRYMIRVYEGSWEHRTERRRGYWELQFKRGNNYESFHTVGFGVFDPLDPEVAKKYKAIKLKSQQKKMDEIAGKKTEEKDNKVGRAQKKLGDAMLMLSEGGMSHEELAAKFGYTKHSVNQMLCEARKRRKESEEE